jgi:hypothetical protein
MMTTVELADVESLPNVPAVFVVWFADGPPYLSKTGMLRRRLLRVLRLPNLRERVAKIEHRLTGSRLDSAVVLYEAARALFPESY